MEQIILKKENDDFYVSDMISLYPDGWKNRLSGLFGETLEDDSSNIKQRVELFLIAIDELEQKSKEQEFWFKIVNLMKEHDAFIVFQDKWEILYLLAECIPIKFRINVGFSLLDVEEDNGTYDASIEVYFDQNTIDNSSEKNNFTNDIMANLLNDDNSIEYTLSIDFLRNMSLTSIEKHLKKIDFVLE